MFRRLSTIFSFLILAAFAFADESYLGIFIQGKRIGYAYSANSDDKLGGKPVKKFVSKTVMNMGMLGSALSTVIDQTSWTTPNGRPTLMKFSMTSAGRSQKVEANFLADGVHLAIDNNGSLSTRTLAIPKDAPIVDDAMNALLEKGTPNGKSATFYVLDPTTAGFVKNTATLIGPSKVDVDGQSVDAIKATIAEPRMTMTIYMSSKGDLIKAEAMGGIELRPLSKEEALAETESGSDADLAEMTKIPLEPPLGNSASYSSAKYRFEGGDLSRAPNDISQSIKKDGEGWLVSVTPVLPNTSKPIAIALAGAQQPKWLGSGLNIPATDPNLKARALQIIGKEKMVVKAAKAIGGYVHQSMNPNAGIGVLRDAREVYKTKEGVCRDYAILTAALMRSAKIPARLASGLVYAEGAFYYHAWVEIWDGKNWYGVDSTRGDLSVTAGHIKLAHGTVEDAFLFTFLDHAKVRLLQKTPKRVGSKA